MIMFKKITQCDIKRNILRWILLMSVFLFFVPGTGYAADKYWIGGTSWWDYSSKWSPAGQPNTGDDVYLTQSDATNRTVWYYNTAYPYAVLNSLTIDATGSGTITLNHNYFNHPLAAIYEYIGYYGTGTFTQSVGTNTITSIFYLGYNPTGVGTYDLSGTGSLSANSEYIVSERKVMVF